MCADGLWTHLHDDANDLGWCRNWLIDTDYVPDALNFDHDVHYVDRPRILKFTQGNTDQKERKQQYEAGRRTETNRTSCLIRLERYTVSTKKGKAPRECCLIVVVVVGTNNS